MNTVCEKDMCTGCMACIEICPKNAISIRDLLDTYNAVIDEKKCIECNACHHICQICNPVEKVVSKSWIQGWSRNEVIRKRAASGGFATELSSTIIKNNGIVYSCVFKDGEFTYQSASTLEELKQFSGSKYVKSNPYGIYKPIREILKSEKTVLFIGLPCHVAALKKFIGKNLEKNLYTVDLICHGTPSPKLLEKFLYQHKCNLKEINIIQFRNKNRFQIHADTKSIGLSGTNDKYSIAFLSGMTYTKNCYNCHYACLERIGDITIGDSWGNALPKDEQERGISIALCQTEKGSDLLNKSNLHLEKVDLEIVIQNNQQLRHPTIIPQKRDSFFEQIKLGRHFDILIWKYNPKQCFRQVVKSFFIKFKGI